MATKSSYILHYTEDCTPKLKVFKTLKALKEFTAAFDETSEDDFLDFVIKGEVFEILENHYKKFIV